MKQTTIYLDDEVLKQLKIQAIETGIPMTTFIRSAIEEKLNITSGKLTIKTVEPKSNVLNPNNYTNVTDLPFSKKKQLK